MKKRDIRHLDIPTDEAKNGYEINMAGHYFQVADAPAGFILEVSPNIRSTERMKIRRGGGWKNSAYERLFIWFPATAGGNLRLIFWGETEEANTTNFEYWEGTAETSVQVANAVNSPVNVVPRNPSGTFLGGQTGGGAVPVFTRYDGPYADVATGSDILVPTTQRTAPAVIPIARDLKSRNGSWPRLNHGARRLSLAVEQHQAPEYAFSLGSQEIYVGPRLIAAENSTVYPGDQRAIAMPGTALNFMHTNSTGFEAVLATVPAGKTWLIYWLSAFVSYYNGQLRILDEMGNEKHRWRFLGMPNSHQVNHDLTRQLGGSVLELKAGWTIRGNSVGGAYSMGCCGYAREM